MSIAQDYDQGEKYSPFDLPLHWATAQHRGHGSLRYDGVNNGCLSFRCSCGDDIFIRIDA